MTPADRAQAAKRLLDDPLATELLDEIEKGLVEAMLLAPDDPTRRECRDTVLTVRKLRQSLRNVVTAHAEATRSRPGIA